MSRSVPALAAVLALGLSGCDHGSSHHQATAVGANLPYTPRAVARAFSRAGMPLSRDRTIERLAKRGRATAARRGYRPPVLTAFFTDEGGGDVQVSVYRSSLTGLRTVQIVIAGQPPPATTTRGNVAVTYPRHGPNTSRVLRALALLPKARH